MVSDSEEDGCGDQPQDAPSASVVLNMGLHVQASIKQWQAEIVKTSNRISSKRKSRLPFKQYVSMEDELVR